MNRQFDLNELVRDNVKNLEPYSSARDEYSSVVDEMVFLDANENPNENGVNRYPDPHQRSLKSLLASQNGIKESQILLGNGSDEILDLIFRAFCEPKDDNVIILPPTYGMYKVLAATNDIECQEVLLDDGFQPNTDKILKVANLQSKLLLLCSPNNPTGNSFLPSRIEKLLNDFNGLVVLDEAYIDFSTRPSWVNRLAEYPNLIVTQTMSKAYGMAGIRLGICYASEKIISILKKIKPPYNVNALTQSRAFQGLSDQAAVKRQVNDILTEREKMQSALRGIPLVRQIYNSDANFILVKVDDANLRYDQLVQKGVVVRNRSSQPMCDNTLRITIGTQIENKKLTQAFKELE